MTEIKNSIFQYSAGGVISRKVKDEIEVLCITTKDNLLSLPKGHIIGNETAESAAIREMREEIGLSSARIIQTLGIVQRTGTEPDATRSQKEITYFLMDGEGYTYNHEENYVWIEFGLAARLMSHSEEQDLLTVNRNAICSHHSLYFDELKPLPDYDGSPADQGSHSISNSAVIGELRKNISSGVVVTVGFPISKELCELAVDKHLFSVPSAGWECKINFNDSGRTFKLCHRSLNNLLDQDLPDNISLFFAQRLLNLSDTKTFFVVNQIRKKMINGGLFYIEGRSENDALVISGRPIGPNLVINRGKIIRVWTREFVDQQLVAKLGLKLVAHNEYEEAGDSVKSSIGQFLLCNSAIEVF